MLRRRKRGRTPFSPPFFRRTKQKGTASLRCPFAPLVWLPQHSRRPAVIRPATVPSQGQAACPRAFFEKRANHTHRHRGARTSLLHPLRIWPTWRGDPERQPVAHLVQRRVMTIALGENRFADGPADGKRRIVPRDADLACR